MSWMKVSKEGRVSIQGVDMGGVGQILARKQDHIAVKWPRGKHWNGNFQPWAYHPPHTTIYKIGRPDRFMGNPPENTEHFFWVDEILEWSNGRKSGSGIP